MTAYEHYVRHGHGAQCISRIERALIPRACCRANHWCMLQDFLMVKRQLAGQETACLENLSDF